MPASRFLKYTGRNWPNAVCSFYLPVSTSREVELLYYASDRQTDGRYKQTSCTHVKRNPPAWKETYKRNIWKRPTKETCQRLTIQTDKHNVPTTYWCFWCSCWIKTVCKGQPKYIKIPSMRWCSGQDHCIPTLDGKFLWILGFSLPSQLKYWGFLYRPN